MTPEKVEVPDCSRVRIASSFRLNVPEPARPAVMSVVLSSIETVLPALCERVLA